MFTNKEQKFKISSKELLQILEQMIENIKNKEYVVINTSIKESKLG